MNLSNGEKKEKMKAALIANLRETADNIEQGHVVPVDYSVGSEFDEINTGYGAMVSVPIDVLVYKLRTTKKD